MKLNMVTATIAAICALALQPSATCATAVSIKNACQACKSAGHKSIGISIQSPLKKEASLIGLAYINYIYQNDLTNSHFCEAMLHMLSQVPPGTDNPYVHLFDKGRGEKMRAVLEDVQLSFDYSIGRSNPAPEKLQKSIDKIRAALK